MNKQLIKETKRDTAFNRILQFYVDGDITLTSEEEEILKRWNHAHKMWIQRKFTEEQIAEKIKEIFSVSIYTAKRDIYQAQALFGGSIKSNKKFLLHHHAEWLLLTMKQFREDKSLVHLVPKLAREYTLAIDKLPEDTNKSLMPPPVMNFFIVEGQQLDTKKNADDVIAQLRLKYGHTHEYIVPEEEIKNEDDAE